MSEDEAVAAAPPSGGASAEASESPWSDPRTPNLFLVGAPRAGTTSLHERLDQHPDVFMSRLKEPHYFSTDVTRRLAHWRGRDEQELARPRSDYLALFAGGEQARYRGESSVFYLYSRDAPTAVHAASPEARILVMVREPLALLRSLHAKFVAVGDEDCTDLERALALEPERRAGRHVPRGVRFPELLFYSDYVRYAAHVRRWLDLFGPERVRVLVLEELNAQPQRGWDELLAFLGVAPVPAPPARVQNTAVEPRSAWLVRRLAGGLMAVNRRRALGQAGPWLGLQDRLYLRLSRWNQRPARPRPLAPDLAARLRASWRPEVEALSALLGRDLEAVWSAAESR